MYKAYFNEERFSSKLFRILLATFLPPPSSNSKMLLKKSNFLSMFNKTDSLLKRKGKVKNLKGLA